MPIGLANCSNSWWRGDSGMLVCKSAEHIYIQILLFPETRMICFQLVQRYEYLLPSRCSSFQIIFIPSVTKEVKRHGNRKVKRRAMCLELAWNCLLYTSPSPRD